MILPQATKVEFWQELEIYEEERKMRYITSVEQIGYDRGVAEEAQRSLLIRQLTRKIGTMPTPTIEQVKALPIAKLESLGEALFYFESIEDLITWLLTFGNLDSINSFPSQD